MTINHNNLLITFITLLTLGSISYLAWIETDQRSATNAPYWTVSFVDPLSDDLSFVIENHSENTAFSYVVVIAEQEVITQNLSLGQTEKRHIHLDSEKMSKNATITVTSHNDSKTIYK